MGSTGNSQLQWEVNNTAFTDSESSTILYFSDDERDTSLEINPVSASSVGYYTCRSAESEEEATVLVTLQDPYLSFTSSPTYSIPLGVRVEISARYAYSSNGVDNTGTGFTYRLEFYALDITNNQTDQVLDEGAGSAFSNNYIYPVYGSTTSGGFYNLTC